MHCPNCGHEWSWGEAPPIHIELDGRTLFEIIRDRQEQLDAERERLKPPPK